MATIKSYTNLEQSNKLAKILPLESADMSWKLVSYGDEAGSRHEPSLATYNTVSFFRDRIFPKDSTIPCWSLAALLDVLSKWAERVNEAGIAELSYEKITKWCVSMLNCGKIKDCYADNPVDACVAMIEELHDLNLL